MRPEKKIIVKQLTDELKDVNPLIFTDYKGIKSNDLNQLRNRLTKIDARYKVIKNRLFKRTLGEVGLGDIPLDIKGPLAIAYGGRNIVDVVKAIVQFAKDNPDTIKVKGGIVDNAFLPIGEIEVLAKLPSKEVLLGRLVGQIAAPLTRIAMVLQGSIQKMACVLDGIAKKKG